MTDYAQDGIRNAVMTGDQRTSAKQLDDLVAAAFHEVSHSIVGRALGRAVDYIVIRDDGSGASYFFAKEGRGGCVVSAVEEAATYFAGLIGERRGMAEGMAGSSGAGWRSDLEYIRGLEFDRKGGKPYTSTQARQGFFLAITLLDRLMPFVEDVARALMCSDQRPRRLEGPDLDDLLETAESCTNADRERAAKLAGATGVEGQFAIPAV
ncbi:MAG: hypothetical protein IID41_14690 [Planctomycetes bacterium]|nr:hypothetical protein [Planctomycetota bacterium]